MNAPTLRGLAVLALLVLAPLRAATIVQSTTVATSLINAAKFGSMGFDWTYQPFNPALGSLTSVALSVSIEGQMSGQNYWFSTGFSGGPVEVTPSVYFKARVALTDEITYTGVVSATGDPLLVYWTGGPAWASISAPISLSGNVETTSVERLASFSGLNPYGHRLFFTGELESVGYNAFASGNVTTTATLTYNYNVPEAGSSMTLLGLALVGLVAGHRRLQV